MKALASVLAILLLAANTGGVAWLVYKQYDIKPRLNDNLLAQVDRLMNLVNESRSELDKVASQAAFPSDEKRKEWKESMRYRELSYESTRLCHLMVREKRTMEAMGLFLTAARISVATPKSSFQTYDSKTFKPEPFANLSKLETLEEEFDVLMLSLLREIK